MSDWQAENNEQEIWPVKYPSRAVRTSSRRVREAVPLRWTETVQADTRELQRRLLRLLLAFEIGAAIAAACVLPLVFLNLPGLEVGISGSIKQEVGEVLSMSSQLICFGFALPLLILCLALVLSVWLQRRLRKGGKS